MRIDFLGLQAFLSIADRGSFLRAAQHLNLSQTAISHRIKKLEDDLGLRLLARTTREVTLTQAGLDFLPKARKSFAELEASLDDLRQIGIKRRERIQFACLPTFATHVLPNILAKFNQKHPRVEIRIYENLANEIADLVQSSDVEFGVSAISINRWDLEIQPIYTEPFVLACHKKHPLAKRKFVSWHDLADVPMVRLGTRASIRLMIDDTVEALKLSFNWLIEVQQIETALALISLEKVSAIVPKINVDYIGSDDVVGVPIHNPTVTCAFGIFTKRGTPISNLSEEFCHFLISEMRLRKHELSE